MRTASGQPARFEAKEVAPGTILIDLGFQQTAGVIASYLLVGGDELALIETGPTTTRANLERGIREAGYELGDVTRLIPTHIHLDHAGAAGGLMRDFPQMRITLYPTGAPFLIDPERLVKSAGRLYGDRMDELWGKVVGLPADRVDLVEDGDRMQAAGRTLLTRHTPGHAGNHIALLDESTGTLFTGDAAGARIAPSDFVLPTVSPPEIDFELWAQTVETMRSLQPERLAVTHFGAFDDVAHHLDSIMPNSERVLDIARRELLAGHADEAVTAAILEAERAVAATEDDPETLLTRMQWAMPAWLATLGLKRVLKKMGELG